MEILLWIGFFLIIVLGAESLYREGKQDGYDEAQADLEDNSWIE